VGDVLVTRNAVRVGIAVATVYVLVALWLETRRLRRLRERQRWREAAFAEVDG
jgi:uncharacterized membrane protein YcjF (UPF0283 family)